MDERQTEQLDSEPVKQNAVRATQTDFEHPDPWQRLFLCAKLFFDRGIQNTQLE